MALYEIPLGPSQRTMTIPLAGGTFVLRFWYADAPEGGWLLDVGDTAGNPILCGLMLVPGTDLIAPYAYLGIGGKLYVVSDGVNGASPTYAGFGVASHVFYEDTAVLSASFAAYLAQFIEIPGPTSGAIGAMEIGVGRIGAFL